MHGFDGPFLLSLAKGASAGKVVLGEVARGERSIRPSPGQRIAVGQQKNIRALNIYSDPDDVVRRLPMFWVNEKPVPSMALELASRALNTEPVLAEDGSIRLAGYHVPSTVPNTLTLNFEGGAQRRPDIFVRRSTRLCRTR
jgi:adenylate cyclase